MSFLLTLYLLAGATLGIIGFKSSRTRAAKIEELRAEFDRVSETVAVLTAEVKSLRAGTPASPDASAETAEANSLPDFAPPTEAPEPGSEAQTGFASIGTGLLDQLEQKLAARWMVWLGGVALALGGTFLVKYAIDQSFLGPTARVTLAFLFGCALVVSGEWLRRRPIQPIPAIVRQDYVPPALSAAGIFIAFASVYAAWALYDLIAPMPAFVLMAALSAAAILLSLLQGPFTALLGILAGFITPLLVPSEQPMAWALFIYLLFLVVAALTIVRFTAAFWLCYVTLVGASLWPLLWLASLWSPGDAAAVGSYAILTCALFLRLPAARSEVETPAESMTTSLLDERDLAGWLALGAASLILFTLVRVDSYGNVSLTALTVFVGLCFVAGLRLPRRAAAPVVAEILVLAAMAAWHLPAIMAQGSPYYRFPGGYLPGPIVPPEFDLFLWTNIGYALLLGIGGYAALWQARKPASFAAVSATAPVLVLAIAYWRIEAFGVNLLWATMAIALAATEIGAAARVERFRATPGYLQSLSAYAACAVAAIGLGAAMALQQAWLTVALSLELPALAWLGRRLQLETLRPIAMAMALIVLVRLVLNYHLLAYPLGSTPGLNWMIYGYGLPAAFFYVAAAWFRTSRDDYLVMTLEIGALIFAVLLVTLEIHNLAAGSLTTRHSGLLEASLHSIAWLGLAAGLLLKRDWANRRVVLYGSRILASAAILQIIVVQVLIENPLWTGEPVGSAPIVNLLLLAYLVPAVLIAAYCWIVAPPARLRLAGGALALLLVLLDISLEVRRSFQGSILSGSAMSTAEWYSYSAAWLFYAGLLLALGIRAGSGWLRYGSLTVLLLTIAKVFVSDMANLSGLYRVASFVGLGLCLIGIGYLYQRFVFPIGRVARPSSTGG